MITAAVRLPVTPVAAAIGAGIAMSQRGWGGWLAMPVVAPTAAVVAVPVAALGLAGDALKFGYHMVAAGWQTGAGIWYAATKDPDPNSVVGRGESSDHPVPFRSPADGPTAPTEPVPAAVPA